MLRIEKLSAEYGLEREQYHGIIKVYYKTDSTDRFLHEDNFIIRHDGEVLFSLKGVLVNTVEPDRTDFAGDRDNKWLPCGAICQRIVNVADCFFLSGIAISIRFRR